MAREQPEGCLFLLGCRPAFGLRRAAPAAARATTRESRQRYRPADGSYFVEDLELSPLATAYARARGADRLCSFGDFIALSDTVDAATAALIAREVSDGVIAPGYEPTALEMLKAKKQGKYALVQIDPAYEPPSSQEVREVFGIRFEQHRHDRPVSPQDFTHLVTAKKDLPPGALQDLTLAWLTLKYTQSNSVCFVAGGQTIGVGAGQQSRIHCVRLAAQKADLWFLRQHPSVLICPSSRASSAPTGITPSTSSCGTI